MVPPAAPTRGRILPRVRPLCIPSPCALGPLYPCHAGTRSPCTLVTPFFHTLVQGCPGDHRVEHLRPTSGHPPLPGVWGSLEGHSTRGTNARSLRTEFRFLTIPSSGCYGFSMPSSPCIEGPVLREARWLAGLSQEALAEKAGVSLATITRIETRDLCPVLPSTLKRLSLALEVAPKEMLGGTRASA